MPAPGVRVSAMALEATDPGNKASAALASLTQTDSAGRYRLENIPPGNYHVTAGSLQLPTYYPGVISRSQARALALSSGATAQEIDFKLMPYPNVVKVRGRVINIPQKAPAGFLGAFLISGESTIPTRLEANGSFEFPQTPPGDYLFALTPRGTAAASTVRVRGADISDLLMEMLPAVFGRVRVDDGSPVPANMTTDATSTETPAMVSLAARSTAGGGFRNAFVRTDGVLVLAVATPGDYWINVSRLPLGYSVKEMLYGGVDLREKALRIVETNTEEIEITLTRTSPIGVKVSGRVIGMSLSAPRSLWIALKKNSPAVTGAGGLTEHMTQTLVNPDGTFEFAGIPPGNYMLSSAEFPGPNLVLVGNRDVSGIVLEN
jgi:hypothetical protein